MTPRQFLTAAALAAFCMPAGAQIATSNEDGATGAYSSEVDSSFTSEGRFGPRTAIDDLRADVDRDKEQIERVRQKQLRQRQEPPPDIEPFIAKPQAQAEDGADRPSESEPQPE